MNRSIVTVAVLSLLFVSSLTFAAKIPKSIPWVDTGPFEHVDGSGPHRDSTNFVLHARAAQLTANANAPASRDVGDVAVIVDDGTLIIPPIPPNPYDLGTTLTFVPGAGDFSVSSAAGGPVAEAGTSLVLSDDSAVPLPDAPFSFTFFGTPYGGAAATTRFSWAPTGTSRSVTQTARAPRATLVATSAVRRGSRPS